MTENKKHEEIVYIVYNYLHSHHLGSENKTTKGELANALGLTLRQLRRITMEINTSADFEKLISTTSACYMCNTEEECRRTLKNTYLTAISLLRKARAMETKVGLNGQIKLLVGDILDATVMTFEKADK